MTDLNNINYDDISEKLFEKDYAVIDFLPEQVSKEKADAYSRTEKFYLDEAQRRELYRRFAYVLIKLSSYYDFVICDNGKWYHDHPLAVLSKKITGLTETAYVNILLPEIEALITFNGGDLYMTVYNYDETLFNRIKQLALSEGLFVRRNIEDEE